ncbi:hypothetical protein NDU88_004352 [Pleurodeles waltl]|uniref:Uncharacterized protein n=1 Tax=Pleurodeles waltl TaxID=8319 RepID=A0AAV7TRM1_PLEWA|nr:hypothetical protein NDU88_004352 [Pleurodeles waltl]
MGITAGPGCVFTDSERLSLTRAAATSSFLSACDYYLRQRVRREEQRADPGLSMRTPPRLFPGLKGALIAG